MRRAPSLLFALAMVAGCPREAPLPRAAVAALAAPGASAAPGSSFVIGDPDGLPAGTAAVLDASSYGALIEGVRVVVRGAEPHLCADPLDGHIASFERVPAWLGGGFLFRARSALYAAATFDGPLRALRGFAESVSAVSFGPRGALVRTADGQRVMLDLATGASLQLPLPGLVDLAALPDGRVAALVEGARLFLGTDHGAHWSEATASLAGAPAAIFSQGGSIWVRDELTRGYELDPSGVLREVDAVPSPAPLRIRPADPAWTSSDAPLVAAVRRGVPLGDGGALVVAAGDVVRVDLRTGAARVLSAGRLPAEDECTALRAGDDVIAVCLNVGHPSSVFAHLAGESPQLERVFPVDGPFTAADDGALVLAASCDGALSKVAACARDLRGQWTEHRLPEAADAGAPDAGAPPIDPDHVRWIPREGGPPLAIPDARTPAVFDPARGTLTPLHDLPKTAALDDVVRALAAVGRGSVDRSCSAQESGALRVWLGEGRVAQVALDGRVTRSPFHYPYAVAEGRFALAARDAGRLFQTTDHGETWTEVAGLALRRRGRMVSPNHCSPVGCDLGGWLRLGWEPTPPVPRPESKPVEPPPVARAPRPPLRELVCSPLGAERPAVVRRVVSDEEFGFGARRVPMLTSPEQRYLRRPVSRGQVHPGYGRSAVDGAPSQRALVHGWAALFTPPPDLHAPLSGITVLGPNRSAESFRREIDFLEPFDPEGPLRHASFSLRDLAPAARAFATPLGQLYASDGPEIEGFVPILPADPSAPSGLVFDLPAEPGQLVLTLSAGASTRLTVAGARVDGTSVIIAGAAELPGGELVLLGLGTDGSEEILSAGPQGVTLLHPVPTFRESNTAPPNPDALAVGPAGALGILRTPSGAEPPTAADPALLFPVGRGPVIQLAPWSTLTAADDPACRADPAGWRAIVQPLSPWLRVRAAAPSRSAPTAAMLARVRWSAARVCLEAVEVPEGTHAMRAGEEIETAVVARFAGKAGAGRIGVGPGMEVRQALRCALAAP